MLVSKRYIQLGGFGVLRPELQKDRRWSGGPAAPRRGFAEVRRAPPPAAPAVTEPLFKFSFFFLLVFLNIYSIFLQKSFGKKKKVALKIQFNLLFS